MARMPTSMPGGGRVPQQRGVRLPVGPTDIGQDELANAAQAFTDRHLREREQSDKLALIGATTRLGASETERLVADGDALKEDELDGFSTRFSAGFDAKAAEMRETLSPRVRAQFDALATETRADLNMKAMGVERTRRTTRDTRRLDDQLDDVARTVASDPSVFDTTLVAARQAIEASLLPQADKEARLGRLENQLARERFLGLANSNPDAVAAELEDPRWASLFTPEQSTALRDTARERRSSMEAEAVDAIDDEANAAINRIIGAPQHFGAEITRLRESPVLARLPPGVRTDVLTRVAGRAAEARLVSIGEANPWSAKQELLSGQHDSYLDSRDKQRILLQMNGEIDRRNAAARAEAAERARDLKQANAASLEERMNSHLLSLQNTGRGVAGGVSVAEVRETFGEARARAFEQGETRVRDLYVVSSQFRFASPASIRERIDAYKPKGGSATYATDTVFHAELAKAGAAELERRRADPAGAVLRQPSVARALALYERAPTEGTRQAYVTATRRAQAEIGIPSAQRRVVPEGVVTNYVDRLKAAPQDARGAELAAIERELTAAWGPHAQEALGRVLGQENTVAGAPALAAIADPATRQRFAHALTTPLPSGALPDGARKEVRERVERELRPLIETMQFFPDDLPRVDSMREAAVAAALRDVAGGVQPTTAARNAASAFTAQVRVRDGLRIPRRWNGETLAADRVLAGADWLRDELIEADRLDLPAGDARLRGEAAKRASATAARVNTRWVPLSNGRGVALWNDRLGAVVGDKDGAPITAEWGDLLEAEGRHGGGAMTGVGTRRMLEGGR